MGRLALTRTPGGRKKEPASSTTSKLNLPENPQGVNPRKRVASGKGHVYASRPKTNYCFELSAAKFLETNEDPRLLTLTFAENVTSKAEAVRRWKPLRDWFARRKIRVLFVWQRQRRGAWHIHAFISEAIDIVEFRAFAVARGWGSFLNITRLWDLDPEHTPTTPGGYRRKARRIVRYLTRYLTRDLEDGDEGEQLIGYVGEVKVATVTTNHEGEDGVVRRVASFAWAGGLAAAVRFGRSLFYAINGRLPRWSDSAECLLLGLGEIWGNDNYRHVFQRSSIIQEFGAGDVELVPF